MCTSFALGVHIHNYKPQTDFFSETMREGFILLKKNNFIAPLSVNKGNLAVINHLGLKDNLKKN